MKVFFLSRRADSDPGGIFTYYLDGRVFEHTDFRGNTTQKIYNTCCGRLQATIAQDGQSTTIYNTDFEGQATHTITVSSNPAGNWHDPLDADTLQEVTTRFDGRGRPTHSTRWLVPLGNVYDDCCGGSGTEPIPIAGLRHRRPHHHLHLRCAQPPRHHHRPQQQYQRLP